MEAASYVERAEAILAAVERDDMSLDLQSVAASYEARRDAGDERGRVAYARSVVRFAEREDLNPATMLTAKELAAEIKTRNEGRDEADRIRPVSRKREDLEAALEADDADRE